MHRMNESTQQPRPTSDIHVMEDVLITLSHELRTPLAAAKGYATALLRYDERLSRTERLAMVGEIDLACDRLESVIAHLLQTAHLVLGTTTLLPHPHDLVSLTHAAIAQLEQAMPAGAAREPAIIVQHDQKQAALVSVDGRLLTTALAHLLQNARNASPTGQPITVTIHTTGDSAEWNVYDRGVGIAANHLPHIFTPFYRAAPDLTREGGGLGLGLTLSQRVIALHGGVLQGESQLGQGSRFWFTLPLVTTVG